MFSRILIFSFFLFFYCSVPANEDFSLSKGEAHAKLSRFIEGQLLEQDVNGVSVAVIHGQNVWFKGGFGLADAEIEIAAESTTQYRLGAVSTVLTSLLVLQLQEKNLLNIDDKVSKHFPKLTFFTRDNEQHEITIRQLLTHHSGLPLSVLKNSWSNNPEDFTRQISDQKTLYLTQKPDTIYTYSNIAFNLLGYIVENVTGLSFEDALQKYLLKPFEMKHTGIANPKNKLNELASAYKKKDKKSFLFPRDLPSMGMYSSADDLGLLFKKLNASLSGNPDSLPTDLVKQMIKVQNTHVELDLGKRVGMAWFISDKRIKNAGTLVWRGGASLFHRSRIAYLPERQLGVVVLANDSRAWEAVEEISDEALRLALESLYAVKSDDDEDQKVQQTEVYGVTDNFAESYSSFIGYIPVEKGTKSIKAELLGWTIIAKPEQDGWYSLQYDLFGFIPIDITWITDVKIKPVKINDRRVLIALYKGTQYLFASHVILNKPSKAWLNRLGEYELKNPDALSEAMEVEEGELIVEDDRLFFLYELPLFIGMELKVPLDIIDDQNAIIPGLGTALNELVRVKKIGSQEILDYSGYHIGRIERKGLF